MSAEVLRRAASLMRERADTLLRHSREHGETTGGPDSFWSPSFLSTAINNHAPGQGDPIVHDHSTLGGMHLAAWTPAVALAVADWLDRMARALHGTSKGDVPFEDDALAVARAYLGEGA